LQLVEQLLRARPTTATLQIARAHRHARSVPPTALGHAVSDIPYWALLVRRADAHGKHRSEALRHAASARTALHRGVCRVCRGVVRGVSAKNATRWKVRRLTIR
jgi:hypothetical protein